MVLRALRGRRKTAEKILENVGRQDPSMDDVAKAGGGSQSPVGSADGSNPADDRGDPGGADPDTAADPDEQASLGDFG